MDIVKAMWLRRERRRRAVRTITGVPPLTFKGKGKNLKNYRIYGNTVNGNSVGDLVSGGEHEGEYLVPVKICRKAKHTATLQLHDCLPAMMQIDAPEALYYAENGLAASTYCFTIQADYDTAYGGGKTYQFTLANNVPAGGQLTFGWVYNTQAVNSKITSYASSGSTNAIEQVSVTEGSGGTSLGTTDGNSTNVNHILRLRFGSNNYAETAIRQFLNSSSAAGSVWTPQTKYDRPPTWSSDTAGFLSDFDSSFLAAVGVSQKITALNYVMDAGGTVVVDDKFFLLSRSEVYGGLENGIDEGSPYPYYSDYSDLSSPGLGNDANRIKSRNGTAQKWTVRTPIQSSAAHFRNIETGGNFGNIFANNFRDDGLSPACNIELDEDYKFNGQVLHVRDQISVTKGNDTLVFDVIGIDHDEVNFDITDIDLYLPEQLRIVNNESEYIDYASQKQYFADGTSADVTLPALPTLSGTNTLSVGTEIQPSQIEVRGRIKQTL